MANRLGDPTARLMGRLTLNPLAHLDPFGTLLLFLANFGWARPVPVDPRYFKNPQRDMLLVALAGPMSNVILAAVFGTIYRLLVADFSSLPAGLDFFIAMLRYAIFINLVLAFFNLIPIPPLDGSRILRGLLSPEAAARFAQFESYGPFLLIGLILLGRAANVSIFWRIIGPLVELFAWLFAGMRLGNG
ncbi:MAG: site-2 protease family protein [candidate division KSB1 bacterium]|nr:site-2 protease family protein [candidate division KSB1 bacterium]